MKTAVMIERRGRAKFSGLQNGDLKRRFIMEVHPHRVDSGALAFVRLYVWLVLVKVVRI
jgi:hypothetical protein